MKPNQINRKGKKRIGNRTNQIQHIYKQKPKNKNQKPKPKNQKTKDQRPKTKT